MAVLLGSPQDGGRRLAEALVGAGRTLPDLWCRRWAAEPDRPTLRCTAGRTAAGGGTTGWCRAGELEERTRGAAAQLAARGLGRGDRLLWAGGTSLDALVAALGCLRLGAVLVPANPAYTRRELAHVVADVRPRVALVERPEQARWVNEAPPCPAVVGADLAPLEGRPSPRPADDPPLDRSEPADPALIVFTSGTTGAPKGAVLSHANLLAGAVSLQLAWDWEPTDRLVLSLPLCHVHGLCVGLFGTLAAGASAVVLPRFGPDAVLDAAAADRATLFFGVPTMYHRLLASERAAELARLRLCVSGSAPLSSALFARAQEAAGVTVLERYGMSETLLTLSNPLDGARRPGTVGLPLPGTEVRLGPDPASSAADRSGDVAEGPPTEGGDGRGGDATELFVRGPTVFAGYWERPAATAESFDGEWFRTGDLATVDPLGYVCIRGRAKELVISGGWNVYPAEVEDVLAGCPGVREVAVTGTPSEEWGEAVTAWVVTDGSWHDPSPLLAYAADRLAAYKQPRIVRFVDALPRNALGKVVRSRLSS